MVKKVCKDSVEEKNFNSLSALTPTKTTLRPPSLLALYLAVIIFVPRMREIPIWVQLCLNPVGL
jgi:hypothetical protein